ncbi:MAG: hypothetical protein KA773_23280 [Chloroflexi bacterium]|nr:hypothetical protein [Chloroflexota bacterium]
MLRIHLTRVLFACLVAAMLIGPATLSLSKKQAPLPIDPGIVLPMGDCPNPAANTCV